MGLYQFLTDTYTDFISIFPPSVQWLITLLILAGLVGALLLLVRANILFIVIALVILPFLIPVVVAFATDLYHFFAYLAEILKLTAPKA